MRYKIVALENKAYCMVAVRIPVPVLILFCGYAVYDKVAAVITVKTADNIKECGFSRTARAEYRNKFVVTEIKAYTVKCSLFKLTRDIFFFDIFLL